MKERQKSFFEAFFFMIFLHFFLFNKLVENEINYFLLKKMNFIKIKIIIMYFIFVWNFNRNSGLRHTCLGTYRRVQFKAEGNAEEGNDWFFYFVQKWITYANIIFFSYFTSQLNFCSHNKKSHKKAEKWAQIPMFFSLDHIMKL